MFFHFSVFENTYYCAHMRIYNNVFIHRYAYICLVIYRRHIYMYIYTYVLEVRLQLTWIDCIYCDALLISYSVCRSLQRLESAYCWSFSFPTLFFMPCDVSNINLSGMNVLSSHVMLIRSVSNDICNGFVLIYV